MIQLQHHQKLQKSEFINEILPEINIMDQQKNRVRHTRDYLVKFLKGWLIEEGQLKSRYN